MKPPARNPPPHGSPRAAAAAPGRVRVIGGRWRGTRLPVADAAGLRPTSDRVRETLFNWLMPALPGARVLDLFAGSGALGLEALSRGAASAVLVERDRQRVQSLGEVLGRLPGGEGAQVVCADALAWLPAHAGAGFDIAFVDPPFADDLWQRVLPLLLPTLAGDAWLYLESPRGHGAVLPPAVLPPEWRLHREGSTRDVRYALYRRDP